jgi:hypothetical protein
LRVTLTPKVEGHSLDDGLERERREGQQNPANFMSVWRLWGVPLKSWGDLVGAVAF